MQFTLSFPVFAIMLLTNIRAIHASVYYSGKAEHNEIDVYGNGYAGANNNNGWQEWPSQAPGSSTWMRPRPRPTMTQRPPVQPWPTNPRPTPSRPVEPTDPSEPSEPVEPTNPSDPTPSEPATPPPSDGSDRTKQMLCLVNQIRSSAGKPPLKVDSRLMKAAQLHSEDQAAHKQMTHTGTKIPFFDDRIKAQGYKSTTASENVAWNQRDISEVVSSWKQSSGHYKNMIGNFECFGWGEKNLYWTQNFASGMPCSDAQPLQC